MAISRDKKSRIVADISSLLDGNKMSVFAYYDGINVAQAQELRKLAKEHDVKIRVVKNRLVKVALSNSETYKNTDVSSLTGQLLYAFSNSDEVSPAQTLYNFSISNPDLKIAGGFDENGVLMSADQVVELAKLPTKEQLYGLLVGTIAAPISGMVSVLRGNISSLINVINAKAAQAEG